MTKLLESRKAKIILGAMMLVVVLAVVLIVVLGGGSNSRGFRIIRVSELSGTATVTSEGKEYAAYKDMKLGEGYALVTGADSFVRMVLDDDKYIRVEEDSKITFETLGKSGSGRTAIYLEYGAITNEVTTVLGEDEEYIINTPNTALAIKGTFFRVAVEVDKDGAVSVDVFTYGGVVECKRILPNGEVVDESTLIEAGYKTKVYMTSEDTVYQVEGADGKENVAVLSVNEIPDADIVDMYVASMNGHEMFIDTEEIWEVIEEREIDIEDYTSNRDGKVVAPLDISDDDSSADSDAEMDLTIEGLYKNNSWICLPEACYAEDGSIIWEGDDAAYLNVTKYSEVGISPADFRSALEDLVAEFESHGYVYEKDISDILMMDEALFEEKSGYEFQIKLADQELRSELETIMWKLYVDSGKEIPEGDDFNELDQYIKSRIDEYTTLGIKVHRSPWEEVYSIEVYGRFCFDENGYIMLTENMEYFPHMLEYDEEKKVWFNPEL